MRISHRVLEGKLTQYTFLSGSDIYKINISGIVIINESLQAM